MAQYIKRNTRDLKPIRTLNELGSFATITDGVIFHNTLAHPITAF